MSHIAGDLVQDAMQVCRNGHVITDLAHAHPERRRTHCDRCGATTLDRCATCGTELPGTVRVPGLSPVGTRRPPRCCAVCGAAFPWVRAPQRAAPDPVAPLEATLRRLPLVIRQLRSRQGERPPFRVEDERDLEDLVRALLPLHSDDVYPEARTPRYAAGTRTDFRLMPERVAVAVKVARPDLLLSQLGQQLQEDAAYYRGRPDCRALVALVYDPEGLLREPDLMEAAWSSREDDWELRCVIAAPEATPPAA
jgi:DpnII restriction endonuclease/uncharacterized protein DUF2321